jgi:pyridoxine 5-phosphate synthase
MLEIATRVRPEDICLVPERRNEVTTEGGLDVAGQLQRIREVCAIARAQGMRASLFIDPDVRQIDGAQQAGAPVVELHTGRYAQASGQDRATELHRLRDGARHAASLGLTVHAGHGLHYHNVQPVAAIPEIVELNIGHAIIARAVFHGLAQAVSEMKRLMIAARGG